MKIETKENQIILKEVYNSITLETKEGKQLHICMRDMGFEMKIDDGNWHLLTNESDFEAIKDMESKLADAWKEGYKSARNVLDDYEGMDAAYYHIDNDRPKNPYKQQPK